METPQLNPANPAETTADDPNAHEPMTHNPRGPSVTAPEGYMGAAQQEQDVPYPLLFAPATEKNDSRPAVLLILVPGVFLHPSDYGMLCARIRDASKDCPLALWFCIPSMSWRFEPQSVQNQVDDALESALQTAIAKGFEPLVLYPGGRNENVFVAMHSAAIMGAAGFPLKRSAGILALGSMLMPSENINMDAYTYPRPLMHIWGERDGQFSLIKASLGASRALARDLPLGFNVISSVRPLLVVPGMNHAQFSDGIVRKERGDLDPNVSQDEALTIVAQGILHFLIVNCAHMGIPTAEVSNAVQVLASMTEEAARFIDPPAVALGRASPRKLVQLSKLEDNKVKPLSQKEETEIMLLALSCGAEAYPKSSRIVEQLAHPGEVKLAREFAIHAQYQVLKNSIASEVTDTVRVAATVHVLKDTFLRSQSEVIKTGLGWGIHVHILLYWEGLSSTYSPLTFVSPRYALKLKDGKQLLMVLGSEASLSKGADRSLYSPSSACKGLYESALAMVNEKSRERFFSEGSQLNFVEESLDTPMAWVEKDIYCRREDKTNNSADRIVSVCLPCTSSPASEHPSSSAGRFSGAFYFKCPSLAWMVEWVLGGFAKFS